MFYELLLVGTIWFWLPLLIIGIAISELFDQERNGLATMVLLLTVAVIVLFSDFNPFGWMVTHPWLVLGGFLAYVIVGAVWGIIKWGFWLRRTKRRVDAIDKELRSQLRDFDERSIQMRLERELLKAKLPSEFPPMVSQHKSKIVGWMCFWPCSVIWTLISDFVRGAFEEVYHYIAGVLQEMSNRVFADRVKRPK